MHVPVTVGSICCLWQAHAGARTVCSFSTLYNFLNQQRYCMMEFTLFAYIGSTSHLVYVDLNVCAVFGVLIYPL